MAQTKPKAAQFYGVSGDGTAGQVLISDGNGGMSWGANTENYTVSWNTPTGQSLTYTQPTPQSSSGSPGSAFTTTTFTVTKSDTIISGTATIAGLPTGVTATQVITGSGIGNTLTVTLSGVFPSADSLNTDLTLSGLTLSKTVSWATPTGQSLTYTQPSPQSSTGNPGTTFTTTTFTATKSGEEISGTATIAGLPAGITATQSLSGSGADNILTVTLAGIFPGADSLNTALTISGLTVAVPLPPLTVDYLVVAGAGGGGGVGGGGGAGGYRTNYLGTSLTLVSGTNYTVTIGAGGAPSATGAPWNGDGGIGANGSNSVFSTITSAGGGGGAGAGNNAGSGGSGGGTRSGTPGSGNTPSVTPSQGNSGGNNNNIYIGGGGGGATQAGNTVGQNGGNGASNSITGNATYYSGGGVGGGGSTGGLGGGGGGNGGAGTPNTGGGGGGGPWTNNGNITAQRGGAGGSGVVILRYPSDYTISGLSGTTTIIGSDKVTTFTNSGTGNIQFN